MGKRGRDEGDRGRGGWLRNKRGDRVVGLQLLQITGRQGSQLASYSSMKSVPCGKEHEG